MMLRKVTLHISVLLLLFATLLLVNSSCVRKDRGVSDVEVFFSAEKLTLDGTGLHAENDSSVIFKDGQNRSDQAKRTGNYSFRTTPKNKYALSVHIPGIRPDSYVNISVWRNTSDSKSHLISSSTTPHFLYKSANFSTKKEDGWEKLELEFFIPPNYPDDVLKIYVWNNTGDTVFFDDLSISVHAAKTYPTFNEQAIYIETDTSEFIRLMEIRKTAFEVGILQSADDHWMRGFVFGDDKMMKTKLRLKGDWLDHLHGDKWSFRLKLKKGNTWKRLRTYSLQTPVARHGVDEWYLHKICQSQGLLTTRYGFVPTYFNNKNLGIYAWEEHFTKNLVESQDKREGPILRFFENAYWDEVRGRKAGMKDISLPNFEAASIKPFTTSKILEDTAAFNQFLIAQNLVYQYKKRTKTASEIFNLDALAKYFAICDVFLAHHSYIWHNQRFYYNPVLCKLEPILFDAYTDRPLTEGISRSMAGNYKNDAVKLLDNQFLMKRELFNDFVFINKYIEYLELYSAPAFQQQMSDQYKSEALGYDSLIAREFPEFHLSIAEMAKNAELVSTELPAFMQMTEDRQEKNEKWLNVSKTEDQFTTGLDGSYAKNLVQVYKQRQQGDSTLIRVVNYFTDPVLLLGTGKTNQKIREFLHPEPELSGYHYLDRIVEEFWVQRQANYLFLMTGANNETIPIEIMHWPEPEGVLSPLQELLQINTFPDSQLIDKVDDKVLHVKRGSYQLDHPVVIPKGYQLVFEAGTRIDLVNGAFIISYSPVSMKGSRNSPIVLTSSDFSSNGFTVLQAGQESFVNHVVFENLNTLDYKGWTLTGAVSFYESDVTITNSRFYRNQCEDALNTIRSEFTVENCDFDYIFGDAFDSDFCTGLVSNTRFTNIGNDAIDFSGSQIRIADVTVNKANDKGISGGEGSTLSVENTSISNSNIGIASKDLSIVEVTNSSILDCNYGLVLLQKKPEYGPAKVIISNTSITNPVTEMLIEMGSTVKFNGKTIKGKAEKLADIFYQ